MTVNANMAAQLIGYLLEHVLDPDEHSALAAEDDLLETGLDSMGLVGLITFIEESFDVTIPPQDVTIESFGTIARIVQYVEGRRSDGD